MEQIVFWILVIVFSFWLYESIRAYFRSGGTSSKSMLIPTIIIFVFFIYFYFHPDISKYHLLWIVPSVIIGEMILFSVIVKLFKRKL